MRFYMRLYRLSMALFSCALIFVVGCGSGGGGGGAAPVTVAISPHTPTVAPNATQNFTATVQYAVDTSVTYSVNEAGGGTITSGGVYTAPNTTGTYHVKATSNADTSKSDTATVKVSNPVITVEVLPLAAVLVGGATQQFTATVSGTANHLVTWSVTEVPGNSLISATGLFTAPFVAGTYHVVATSVADPTVSGGAVVTVNSPPPITVTISPNPVTLNKGGAVTFSGVVTNTSNTAVTYSVVEADGGTVSSAGLYTAPVGAGPYHVKATSVADSSKSDTATININSGSGGATGTVQVILKKRGMGK